MPLISIIGLVWLLKSYYKQYAVLLCILCTVLVLGIATSHPAVRTAYASGAKQLELAPLRSSVNEIITILNSNTVSKVATDYWYGHTLRFWSADPALVASQAGCNSTQPSVITAPNGDVFTHQKGINTALIIDRGGLNYGFWTCTDAQLIEMYGAPSKQLEVPGAAPGTVVKIWIYESAGR